MKTLLIFLAIIAIYILLISFSAKIAGLNNTNNEPKNSKKKGAENETSK